MFNLITIVQLLVIHGILNLSEPVDLYKGPCRSKVDIFDPNTRIATDISPQLEFGLDQASIPFPQTLNHLVHLSRASD